METGIFDDGRYFDVTVEYAKQTPTDLYIRITVINHGDEPAPLVVLPTLWFRNTWSFNKELEKPEIRVKDLETVPSLEADHHQLGTYYLTYHHLCEVLVTDNETNRERLYQAPNPTPYVKDAFHEIFVNGNRQLLRGNLRGTKACLVNELIITPGKTSEIWLRLTDHPIFAVAVFDEEILGKCTGFAKRLQWFQQNRASLNKCLLVEETDGQGKIMLSLVNRDRIKHVLAKLLDEEEFLAPGGIRSLSRYHRENPFSMTVGNETYTVSYQPGESEEVLFGGNSNWRGPVWMPVNYLLLDALLQFDRYYGDGMKMSFPTHSDQAATLSQVAIKLSRRLISLMLPDEQGKRAVHGGDDRYANDPAFKDLILFYEYFHGDDCRGLGASHQAGWSALAAKLVSDCHLSL